MTLGPAAGSKVPQAIRRRVLGDYGLGVFEIRSLSYDHPDALTLTEQVQDYYREIYGGRDEDPLTAEELIPPHGGFVVGYLDGRPVTMGGWLFTGSPPGEASGGGVQPRERVAQIRRMFVVPEARRHGLATSVLTRLEHDAARHGATRIILATGQPQQAAIAFYRRHGYADIAPFGYYAGGGLLVCLGKNLGAHLAGQPTN